MTEKEALLWVLGILGSLCAAVITIDKVLDIIHKYVKNEQAPDDAQNKRMDTLEKKTWRAGTGTASARTGSCKRPAPL